MKRIQLIATSGRLHEYNFLKFVIPNDHVTIYSDTGVSEPVNDEINSYYIQNGVEVISANGFYKVKLRILRILLNLLSGIRMIIQSCKLEYDFCIISYLSTRRAILSYFLPQKRKTILIAHGSDILRKKNFNEFFFKKMLKRSYKIVFNSENVKNRFIVAYGDKYRDKCVYIPFPSSSFERLENAITGLNTDRAKKIFNLPENRIIVVCGHTSTREEQLEETINSLMNAKKTTLSRCHFVFPMTYGNGDWLSYRNTVEQLLSKSTLSYTVLKDYCDVDKIAALHFCSNIFINTIVTDALSIFMQEELYLGAYLIYGKWLDYPELRNIGAKYYTIDSFSDLASCLDNLVENVDLTKPANKKETISVLKSISAISQKWNEILENQ